MGRRVTGLEVAITRQTSDCGSSTFPNFTRRLRNLLIWRERRRFLEVGEKRILDRQNIDARGDGVGRRAGCANRLRLGVSILGVGVHGRGDRTERRQRIADVVVSGIDRGRRGRRELARRKCTRRARCIVLRARETDLKGVIRSLLESVGTLDCGSKNRRWRRGAPSWQGRTKIRGGRSVERLTDRRRERGDGPLSFDRRLAGRRGVSDSVGCDRRREVAARRGSKWMIDCWLEPAARGLRSAAARDWRG